MADFYIPTPEEYRAAQKKQGLPGLPTLDDLIPEKKETLDLAGLVPSKEEYRAQESQTAPGFIAKLPQKAFERGAKHADLAIDIQKTKGEQLFEGAMTAQEQAYDKLNEILQTPGLSEGGKEKALKAQRAHPARESFPPSPWPEQEEEIHMTKWEPTKGVYAPTIPGEIPTPEMLEESDLRRERKTTSVIAGGIDIPTPEELRESRRMEEEAKTRKMIPEAMQSMVDIRRAAATEAPKTAGTVPETPVTGAIWEAMSLPWRTTGGGLESVYQLLRGILEYSDVIPMSSKNIDPKTGEWRGLSAEKVLGPLVGSVTGRKPIYVGDYVGNRLKEVLGRDLTTGENLTAQVFGLVFDLATGKYLFPQFGGGAQAENLGGQIQRGMRRAARDPKVAARTGGTIASPEMLAKMKPELQPLMEIINEPRFANRIWKARKMVYEMGKQAGADMKFLRALDQEMKRIWGFEATRFTKRGMGFAGKEVVAPFVSRKVPQQVPGFRYGEALAGKKQGLAQAMKEPFQWGAAASEDFIAASRQGSALQAAMAEEYGSIALEMRKYLTKKQSKELGLYMDTMASKAQLAQESQEILPKLAEVEQAIATKRMAGDTRGMGKLLSQKKDFQAQLFEKEHGFHLNMIKNGFATVDDLKNQFARFTPAQKVAMKEYRASMDDMLKAFTDVGGNAGYRKEVVSRFETTLARKRRKQITPEGTAKPGTGGPAFAKHRLELQEGGVAIGQTLPPKGSLPEGGRKWWSHLIPTKSRVRPQFTVDLAEGMGNYTVANSIATANAHTENLILGRVGKALREGVDYHVTADGGINLSRQLAARAESHGMKWYQSKMGKRSGEVFMLPAGDVRMLEKMADPEQLSTFLQGWKKFNNFWKAGATLWRPGFAMRNIFFGNLYQMWLMDVPFVQRSLQAARLQAYMYGQRSDGMLANVMTRKMFGMGKPLKGTDKIGKYTLDELSEMVRQHAVKGMDFFSQELAHVGKGNAGEFWNPFGGNFLHQPAVKALNTAGESNGRLAIMIDKIAYGNYSMREVEQIIAKSLFNYNEMTRFGNFGRTIMPFFTWPYKNAGLQISMLLRKPAKMATYLRAKEGIQEFDPLSPREGFYEKMVPNKIRHGGMFRMPFVRGEEGERKYVSTGNLMPVDALNQLAVHKPKLMLRFIADMLHPLPRIVLEQAGTAPTVGSWGHFGIPAVRHEEDRSDAPAAINSFMFWLKEKGHDGLYDTLASTIFRPKHYPLETMTEGEQAPAVGFTVSSQLKYLVNMLDPRLAWAARLLGPDEAYDNLKSFLLGVKAWGLTKGKATLYHLWENREFKKELDDLAREEEEHHDMPSDTQFERFYQRAR